MRDEFAFRRYDPLLGPGEAVLWRGKPMKRAFVTARCLTLMPIAVIWLILDTTLIAQIFDGDGFDLFLIPFTLLHLMPVWIWLGSMFTAVRRWKNTNYFVTSHRVIIQSGIFSGNEMSVFFREIRNARVKVGFWDKLFHTGQVIFDDGTGYYNRNRPVQRPVLENLEDAGKVYDLVQRSILQQQFPTQENVQWQRNGL